MAILQALLTLLGRSAGKVLNAIFGWAVRALFGFTSGAQRALLTALVATAALWPLLLVGVAAPRAAAFALAFVPIPDSVPDALIRGVWILLALAIPLAVGLALAAWAPARGPAEPAWLRIARGVPLTLGIAAAFWLTFVSVPVRRLASALRGERDAHVPLVTTGRTYADTAERVRQALNERGFDLVPREPAFWVRAPLALMRALGGSALRGFVPERPAHFAGPGLEVALYPSGLLLHGSDERTTLAHGLVAEALTTSDALQTTTPAAQEIERQIRAVWRTLERNPAAHVGSPWLEERVQEIADEVLRLRAPYDDWQIAYRELLQLARALEGAPQLLACSDGEEGGAPMKVEEIEVRVADHRASPDGIGQLPTTDLLREIYAKASLLVEKEVELARTEVEHELRAQLAFAKSAGVAVVLGTCTLSLLLVAAVFGLATVMEAWAAALAIAGGLLVATLVAALIARGRRVTQPFKFTRKTLREDMRWAKEKLA